MDNAVDELVPLNMHGQDDTGTWAHDNCLRCKAMAAAQRLTDAWDAGGELGEDDVRAALDLRDAIHERVEQVLAAVRSARGRGANWPIEEWEITRNRQGDEIVDVKTSSWYYGLRQPNVERVQFPLAYLWDPDPQRTETEAVAAAKVATETAARETAERAAAAIKQLLVDTLARELEQPTCRGCGKPATGLLRVERRGLVACCESCGRAAGSLGEYRAWDTR